MQNMSLKAEIELNRPFESQDEVLLLSLIYTNQLVERAAARFLATYDLTPTQFNALMIVRDYEKQGINQSELARRLLINRASTGTLIDNLGQRQLLVRMPVLGDRRAYHLVLTEHARRLLRRIHKPYYARITEVLSAFRTREKRAVAGFLERFRSRLQTTTTDLEG